MEQRTDQKSQAELDFLSAIERGEIITQMDLKSRIGVSVGMVNALVKRAVSKGYAKVSHAPYKRYAYYLTPAGFAEKSRLVALYIESSLSFFREARGQYGALLSRAKASGYRNVALAGQGELIQIAMLAALSEGVAIAGIVDPSSPKTVRFGVPSVPAIRDLDSVDLIVLCETKSPQRAYERLCTELNGVEVWAPQFLRITPNREELLSRVRDVRGA